MIVQLNGHLLYTALPVAIIDVGGIGYEVEMPHSCWYELPPLNEKITLFTRLVVREDAHLLFGFLAKEKRDAFNEILKISGVGPKLALSILSAMPVDQLVGTIAEQDPKPLVAIKGVGAKVAQRLVLDLKGKFDGWQSRAPHGSSHMEQEAIAALMALGYSANQAEKAIQSVKPASDTQSLIRLALQRM